MQHADIEVLDAIWGPLLGEGPYPALIAEVINSTSTFVNHALSRIAPIANKNCKIIVRFTESPAYAPTLYSENKNFCVVYIPIGFVIRIISFVSLILQHQNDGPSIQLLISPINRPEVENIYIPPSLSCLVGDSAQDWKHLWNQAENLLHVKSGVNLLGNVINIRRLDDIYADSLLISAISCSFAVFHEVAHALECHLTARQWVLKNIERGDIQIPKFLKGLEVRADVAATTYMVATLKGLRGIESKEQARNFIIAISALFSSLDVNRRAFKDYHDGDYFPPTMRLISCISRVREMLGEQLSEEWNEVVKDGITYVTSNLDYCSLCYNCEYPIHAINFPPANSPAYSLFVDMISSQTESLKFAEYFLGIEDRGII